ncbi:MAG TPA: prolyl oligopeptidase family serine peptidase [Terriglobales bacterium]|jgi:prolyl oligopeptidase|nr:prolyl oligopeptidase family serine peptidase [Terriglobales bacterium]
MPGGPRLSFAIFVLVIGIFAMTFVNDSQAADLRAGDSTPSTPPGPHKAPPIAKPEPVEDTLHGHKIIDPYRYLENPNDSDTKLYVEEELSYTRSILDPLPGRDKINARLSQLLMIGTVGAPQLGGKYYFHTRREGNQNQPILYVREGLNGEDKILLDVNHLSADGTVALDWWYASEDGKYVAYGTSPSGSEVSTLRVIETATGKLLPDSIERTRAASLAWKHDNSGFFYTRYPKKGDVPAGQEVYYRHVFYHALETDPAQDPLIFGEGRDPEWWPNVNLSDDGRWLLIDEEHGWTKTQLFLQDLTTKNPPVEITIGKDFQYVGDFFEGKVYITTNEGAPRYRVFVADTANPKRENWKEIIPQSDAVLQNANVTGGKLLAQYEHNATSELKLFSLDGKKLADVPLPAIGNVFSVSGRYDRDEIFFGFQSFTVPPSVYRVDLTSVQSALWAKVDAPSIDSSQYDVQQVWYNSKDGTKIPMFIVSKKGIEKNGKNPTLLTGYGGFNVSMTPAFSRSTYLWMEHGGIYAVANLRGGAEFGEEWHRAGMLEKKQNVFDDFIAAGEYLIAQKYTDKDHLAIQGGSNGGLLMGAMITQRPDLFRAVICQVPLLDMLRYQNFQIAKLWIPEYGSADDASQFNWLYAYSPYHHVKQGVEYPAILFMTGDTDTRVDPMHAKKMAALLQAEAKNGASQQKPILLRIETKAGHGQGKPVTKQIEESTDVYLFLFWQLGVTP